MMYSWGRMCSTSRSIGMATALAASITRSTSLWVTSLFFTATMPWLLKPLMCPPAIPVKTELISHPAISSASFTALLMESTVLSILMTTPLRNPWEGWEPTPIISIPRSVISPTTAQTFEVPISRPTIRLFLFFLPIAASRNLKFQISDLSFEPFNPLTFRCFVISPLPGRGNSSPEKRAWPLFPSTSPRLARAAEPFPANLPNPHEGQQGRPSGKEPLLPEEKNEFQKGQGSL